MSDSSERQYALFATLPPLSEDEVDDARFRGKDAAWSALAGAFDDYAAVDSSLTYQSLGDRIGRSRSQVQRWLDSAHNITLQSLFLLAEGLDSELSLKLVRRRVSILANTCHPADEAKANAGLRIFDGKTSGKHLNMSGGARGW